MPVERIVFFTSYRGHVEGAVQPDCSICLNSVANDAVRHVAERVEHVFCRSCLALWFQRSHTCPSCRAPAELQGQGEQEAVQPAHDDGLEGMPARAVVPAAQAALARAENIMEEWGALGERLREEARQMQAPLLGLAIAAADEDQRRDGPPLFMQPAAARRI